MIVPFAGIHPTGVGIGSDKSRSLCTEYGDNGLLPSFVQLRGLAKGDYVAVEAKTPEGYQKAEAKAFTIDEKTETYILSLESLRTYGHVDLNLLSSVNRKPLAGGEYVLKDKDRIVATMKTDGNGKSTSIDLPIGEYADGKYLGEKTYQLYEASTPEGICSIHIKLFIYNIRIYCIIILEEYC